MCVCVRVTVDGMVVVMLMARMAVVVVIGFSVLFEVVAVVTASANTKRDSLGNINIMTMKKAQEIVASMDSRNQKARQKKAISMQ